jgi:hypothetical protein
MLMTPALSKEEFAVGGWLSWLIDGVAVIARTAAVAQIAASISATFARAVENSDPTRVRAERPFEESLLMPFI